jgi:hypothetical protein
MTTTPIRGARMIASLVLVTVVAATYDLAVAVRRHGAGSMSGRSRTADAASYRAYLPVASRSAWLDVVENLPANLAGVATDGRYAYVGAARRVLVLDIADPSRPVLVGRGPILPGDVAALVVRGDRLYVAAQDLLILDVSLPSSPRVLGAVATPGDVPYLLAVAEPWAILSGGRVTVIDVRRPSVPVVIGTYTDIVLGEGSFGLAIDGATAYVGRIDSILALAVDDLGRPRPIAVFDNAYGPFAAAGGRLFAFRRPEVGLEIIDLSRPEDDRRVGVADVCGGRRAASVTADVWRALVVVGCASGRAWEAPMQFVVVDVSVPTAARAVGSIEIDVPSAADLSVGGAVLVLVGAQRVDAIDVGDPTRPRGVSTWSPETVPEATHLLRHAECLVVVDGGTPPTTYPVTRSGEVAVLDVTNRLRPRIAGRSILQGEIRAVALDGGRLYAATIASDGPGGFAGEFVIVNVAMHGPPEVMGREPLPGLANAVAASGDVAIVVAYLDGVHVYDVSDPRHPRHVAFLGDMADEGVSAALRSGYAFILGDEVLSVIDLRDPARAEVVGRLEVEGYRYGSGGQLVIDRDRLYVSAPELIQVYDVRVPTVPLLLGEFGTWDITTAAIAVDGTHLAVADWYSLRLYDVTSPARPVLVAETPGSQAPESVALVGDTAYVGRRAYGVDIAQMRREP